MFIRFIILSFILHVSVISSLFFIIDKKIEMPIAAKQGMSIELFGIFQPINYSGQIAQKKQRRGVKKNSATRKQTSMKGGNFSSESGLKTKKSSYSDWEIKYPPMAFAMDIEGRVFINCFLPAGRTRCSKTGISRSSGYPVLDVAALNGLIKYNNFRDNKNNRNLKISVNFTLTN